MSEGKHMFDAAMNKEKSNTDKVVEILNSFDNTGVTVFYDLDYRPPLLKRWLRVLAIAGFVAGIACLRARKRS